MNDGLKDKHRQAIIDILAAHRGVERVVLFGSRAMGTFTATSDVDIALFGDSLSLDDQARLAREIDRLPMPQRVDLLRYRTIKDKKLRAHIRKHGVEWFVRVEPQKKLSGDEDGGLGGGKGGWKTMPFTEAVVVNPSVSLQRGKVYPFVEMAAVDPGARNVRESEYRAFKGGGARFSQEDTLMARITPCLEKGKIARFLPSDESSVGFGSTEFIVIRGRDGVTTDDFAYYLTKWPVFRQYAIGQMTGSSGRQRVPADSLAAFIVSLPSLPIQESIAYILGTLDDKIELNRRMNQTLEKMAAAIFKSWFIDFDSVHTKAEGQDTGLPRGVADLFPEDFDDSVIGKIPKGWTPGALADIANNPRRSIKPEEVPPTTPYIGLQDMPRRCIALDSWGRADEVGSQKSRFSAGEILFGKLRPYFHKVGIAPVSGVCSTDILVIVVKENAWHSYVLSLVSSKAFVDYTDTHSGGTKMPRTNWKDMGRYPLALPPIELAQAFQDYVAPLHQRIGVSVRQNRRLARLRDTLLSMLLSGELELPAIEAVEEGAE